jgi:hypothetical protein
VSGTDTDGAAGDDEAAATTGPGPMPIVPSATSPVTIGPDTDPPVTRVVDVGPVIAQVVDGEAPAWEQTTVGVADAFRSMDVATELVSVDAAGILRRTEVPSGTQRAVGVDLVGQLPFLSVGRTAIVLYSGTRLVLVPDDGPVRSFEIGDGVVSVQARPGTDDFVLTTASTGSSLDEIEFALAVDGSIERIEPGRFTAVPLPARNFLSTGTMLVDGPGGVYALDPAGTAQRVSDGDLVATGANHYAVEECDDALVCGFWLVDAVTGERSAADLAELAAQSTASRSTRISPDGGSVVYRDDTRGTGIRRVVAVSTGRGIDVGRADGFQFEDPWAADSSGIFVERDGAVVFHPRDSADVTLVGRDLAGAPRAPITAIAVRPAP